ncbi:MAG: TIGR00282 family metallophosphoesterase [Acidobacteriota bacterium]
MKILFVGDIVGREGRRILAQKLARLKSSHQIDFTIINVENAAAGFGITPPLAAEILEAGADVMTSGNHIWDKKEIYEYLKEERRLLRPANYPDGVPGYGSYVGRTERGIPVAVLNLQGRIFMPAIDCPFRMADREIEKLRAKAQVIFVDFHAEATSEKMALGWHCDGRVSAIIGTHTHIPTADQRILPGGTAYLTDAGMTGPYHSIIGMGIESGLDRFLTALPRRLDNAEGDVRLAAVVVDVDEVSGRARSIERFLEED